MMQSSTSDSGPDYLYYDLLVSNLNNDTAVLPPPLQFMETRSIPILKSTEDYDLSITRFQLSTTCLPVVRPTIQPNQTDLNLTAYVISMAYAYDGVDYTYSQNVRFVPQNLSAGIPVAPSMTLSGLQDNSTGYYNLYSKEYFVAMINNAFSACNTGLIEVLLRAGIYPPTGAEAEPPILLFDTSTSLSTVYVPAMVDSSTVGYRWQTWNQGYQSTPTSGTFRLYFNSALYSLFSSLPCLNSNGYINPFSGVTNTNMVHQLLIPASPNFVTLAMPIGGTSQYQCWPVVQEYTTVASWSPVASIVFTSTTLPVQGNLLSNPLIYVNNQQVGLPSSGSNFGTILTDFTSTDFKSDGSVTYIPTAEYRRISLIGNRPLISVDVGVFWLDKHTQQLQPFYLLAGDTLTMKLLFERRTSRGLR
jgi:hypothetical protein